MYTRYHILHISIYFQGLTTVGSAAVALELEL